MLCAVGLWLSLALSATGAKAYGPEGHRLVGAIADHRLAGKQAAVKINSLLDGLTLAQAALLPDEIKTWDRNPTAKLKYLPAHPEIAAQLRAFWEANPNSPNAQHRPSHRTFHYTDVPIAGNSKYADGTVGRFPSDIVHMISFCVRVLQGQESESNDYKISKPVAVVLLAHYLGDIHQPLHVGAEFFDKQGQPVNPDAGASGSPDQGGNTLHLVLMPRLHGWPRHYNGEVADSLHLFWDQAAAVSAIDAWKERLSAERPALGAVSNKQLPKLLAAREPEHWKLDPMLDPSQWAEALADEILPIAKQAHEQLTFEHIQVHESHGEPLASGTAKADGNSYPAFAAQVAEKELHKAGWRLAALLEQILP